MAGRTFGRYEVREEIGRGGMGVVYRATDTSLGRDVALKVLSPERLADPELRRRFLREARTTAALQHPAVAVVHEVAETEGAAYIAMELIRGRRLDVLLAEGALPPARALQLALEMAEGLDEAHARGVVHRDLKPANLMLTEAGRLKIIDFGLAKLLDPVGALGFAVATPARGLTDPGRLMGTTAYMSPEQVAGRPVDERSDVFCFGVVLFEMLSGLRCYRAGTAIDTLHAILHADPPRLPVPPGLGPAAAREAQRILDKCLRKDREERYPSMRDLLVDLRALRRRLEDGPGEGAAPAPASREPGVLGVVVVDDEEPARALLREYLRAHADVRLLAECANGFEAVKAVAEHRPDLLLLDVQMPKLSGFEVMELVGREVDVVFVTAFDEYALRAFEVNAVDYLLKPTSAERLAEALARARARRARGQAPAPAEGLLASARSAGGFAERVLVREGADVHVLPVTAIEYVEAQDDYLALRSGGRSYRKQQTLGELERTLDPASFVRVHRSYLVNVAHLAKIELYAKDSRVAILRDGTRLPVSRPGYARLRELL
jgi:two-component system LytT family response regulator